MSEIMISNGASVLGAVSPQGTAPAERHSPVVGESSSADVREGAPLSSSFDQISTTRLFIEDRDGRYIYKIYDPKTGEILQQIPDERLLRQREALEEAAAVLLGVKV